MLFLRKTMWLAVTALLVLESLFAGLFPTEPPAEPTAPPEPDIISAIHTVSELPDNWSPFTPDTEEKLWLRKNTSAPVYTFTADGIWEPVLVTALPEDVTAEYAGTYGIPASAQTGYAFRIQLRKDARWEDGLLITADDYIFSIQRLLEDEENRPNWTFLAYAEEALSGTKKPGSEIIPLRDAKLSNIQDALDAGFTDLYIDTSRFWGLEGGWCPISDRTRMQDFAMPSGMDERFVSPAYLYTYYLAEGKENSRLQDRFIGFCKPQDEVFTMDDLGILKINSFELVFLLDEPVTLSTFIQKFENLFLFRESYWGKKYASSPDTYCSYGPYRITVKEKDHVILEPNEFWFGEPVSDAFDRIICRTAG